MSTTTIFEADRRSSVSRFPMSRFDRATPRTRRRRDQPVVPNEIDGSTTSLSDVLEKAVELKRDAAEQSDIRLRCCCFDDLPVHDANDLLPRVIDAMLEEAVSNAVRGSRIACEAHASAGRVFLRIRFIRPVAEPGSNDWSIEDGELQSSWPLAIAGS